MRIVLGYNFLLLLFIIAFNTTYVSSQDNNFNSLEEGSFWNYVSKLTLYMENYEGPVEQSIIDVMTTKGKASVVEISPSSIIIEEGFTTFRSYYNSATGTDEMDPVFKIVMYTIDRQTLTYTSIKEKHDNGTEVPILENTIGLPCRQLISPKLEQGQKTKYIAYYWKGDIYSVAYDYFDYKEEKIPVISLNYAGVGHYDPDLGMNVTASTIFQFEKSTGLKVSEHVMYEAADFRGKKQVISTYEISSTSLFTPGQSRKTGLNTESPTSGQSMQISELVIPLILAVTIPIILFIFLFLHKRRNTETSSS
jgi:hypothetical protein